MSIDPGKIPPPISPSLGKYVAPQSLKGAKGADLPADEDADALGPAAAPAVGAGSGRVFTKLADSIMPVLRRIQHAVGAVLSLSKPEWLNNAAVIRKLDGRADFLSGQLEKMDKGEMSFADASRIKAELKEIKDVCEKLKNAGADDAKLESVGSQAGEALEQIDAGQLEIISPEQHAQYADGLKGLVAAVKYNYGLNPKFLEEGSKAEKRLNELLEDIDKHLANEKSMTNDELVAISNEILEDILGAELRKIGVKAVPLEIKIEAVALRNQLNEIQRTKIPGQPSMEDAVEDLPVGGDDDDDYVDALEDGVLTQAQVNKGLVDLVGKCKEKYTDKPEILKADSEEGQRMQGLLDVLQNASLDPKEHIYAGVEILKLLDQELAGIGVKGSSLPKELIDLGSKLNGNLKRMIHEDLHKDLKALVAELNISGSDTPAKRRLDSLMKKDFDEMSDDELMDVTKEVVNLVDDVRRIINKEDTDAALNPLIGGLRQHVVKLESAQKPDEAKIQERKQFVANMRTYVNTVMKEYKFEKMKGYDRLQVLLYGDYRTKSESEIAAAGREIDQLLHQARDDRNIEKFYPRIQEQGRAFHKQLDAYEGRWSSII